MRSDDTVETFKSHYNYKICTALDTSKNHLKSNAAEPELIRLHIYVMFLINVHQKR